jgi:cellulose synthase/poly-beta-1,6-N-acetylglucosamine synthase-like glycosyltransferase
MGRAVRNLIASLRTPAGPLAVMAGSAAGAAIGLLYLQHVAIRPLDVSWLYYVNFVLVFGLHLGPVLAYGACALGREQPYPPHPPRVRFLCLIPAHDEERVIRNSVLSVRNQDYPAHLCEVCVVSDGSTDRTDEIARSLGARVLRTGTGGRGKPGALREAFERLLAPDDDRYVCVFDADNRISPNFLAEMNSAICEDGHPCLQGFHDVLNGSDNWLTKSLWVTTVAASHLYNPGRRRLFGTALLGGTGWCCRADVVRRYWPMLETQTEDIELTGLLLLYEGIRVPWVRAARVYDEKPQNVWVAIRQRHRWMTGHMRVACRLFWPCVREGVRRRDARLVELASYYLMPFALNLGNVQVVLIAGMVFGVFTIHGPLTWPAVGWCVNLLVLMYLFVYQVYGFGMETGQWGRGALYSLYAAVASFVTWTPALVWACFTVPRRDWIFHTPHRAGVEPGVLLRGVRAGQLARPSS